MRSQVQKARFSERAFFIRGGKFEKQAVAHFVFRHDRRDRRDRVDIQHGSFDLAETFRRGPGIQRRSRDDWRGISTGPAIAERERHRSQLKRGDLVLWRPWNVLYCGTRGQHRHGRRLPDDLSLHRYNCQRVELCAHRLPSDTC